MPETKSPIEILKLLNKSNCGECNEATCLAFASKVFKGQKSLSECPHVGQEVRMGGGDEPRDLKPVEEDQESVFDRLKERLRTIDLAAAAKRLNTPFKDGILTLKVCGKNFSVDSRGNFSSEIHIHSWVTLPVLNYILEGEGAEPSRKWVPFRELKGGKDWGRFF